MLHSSAVLKVRFAGQEKETSAVQGSDPVWTSDILEFIVGMPSVRFSLARPVRSLRNMKSAQKSQHGTCSG